MYTYKMFDVGSVRELLGLPNPSAAKIPASLAKPERNPLIGDRWGYELANREIGRQATAVGVGTGGSNPASSSMRPRTFGLPHRARRCRNSVTLAGLDRWFESAFLQQRVRKPSVPRRFHGLCSGSGCPDRHALPHITPPKTRRPRYALPPARARSFSGASRPCRAFGRRSAPIRFADLGHRALKTGGLLNSRPIF